MGNTFSADLEDELHVALVDFGQQQVLEVEGPDAVVGFLQSDG